jgi:hypothetical protein
MTQTAGGGSTTDQARETAQQVGTQAKEKAQEAGAQAHSRVRDEVDRRSTEAGDQATSAADAMRQASQQLRDQGNEPVAKGMEQAADRLERAGGWLRDADGDSILRDVEDFGRRNPLAVAAAGLAVGFAASRLLRASSRRRYEGDGSRNGSASLPARTAPPPPTGPGTVTPGTGPADVTSPREGVTEFGPTGGTPATSPPSWKGGLGGEGEGARRG